MQSHGLPLALVESLDTLLYGQHPVTQCSALLVRRAKRRFVVANGHDYPRTSEIVWTFTPL